MTQMSPPAPSGIASAFDHVDTWVFDLDNTLYPPEAGLFAQIEPRMTAWVQRTTGTDRSEASRLRTHYWHSYGTTLAGLMAEYAIDPAAFLLDVHDIDFTQLTVDPALAAAIRALPGRKIIFTNGTAPYAERVAQARGLEGLFDAIYGVQEAGLHPKPRREAFDRVFARDGLRPERAAMFEDDPRNLAVPHALGMRTVHVAPQALEAAHIHHHTADLAAFLAQLGGPSAA
ncbi:haloacid dehalogenase-like hydrolase [Aquimixticola soesokkakensis]|uniref:Haloacid dehalogenase-like hydrolase n=1 Tax=Aquimixticola soesokkakensis TaxID=1519096 RepID=A0A1Y5S984_9RHOB|nr:pyrimidine 5'-nucleotidase [Aquimixticola soesokkakensis]SLN35066.1 haloacid dehalogenase-like hydrolase [Aquimixticola soesokkakensis]